MKVADKLLVGVALDPAQPVIEVGDDERPDRKRRQGAEHCNAVGSTRNRRDQTRTRCRKSVELAANHL